MQINIKGVRDDMVGTVREYAEEKLSVLDRFLDDVSSKYVSVEIRKDALHHQNGNEYLVEIHLKTPHFVKTVKSNEEDVYKAIDAAKDKIVYEYTSYKNKKQSVFVRGARAVKSLLRSE